MGALLAGLFSLIDARAGNVFAWSSIASIPGTPHLVSFFHALDAFAALPMCLLVSAMCACVHYAHQAAVLGSIEKVASAMGRLRLILYASTATLVIGVLEIYSIFLWTAVHAPDSTFTWPHTTQDHTGALHINWFSILGEASVVSRYGYQQSAAMGAGFTLFLAATYITSSTLIRQQTRVMARSQLPIDASHEHIRQWLSARGLATKRLDVLRKAMIILSPMLVGAAGEFAVALGRELAGSLSSTH